MTAGEPEMTEQASYDLVLLANEAMLARRRPGAILAVWAFEAATAAVIAWPVAATVGVYYGSHPQSDAPLWSGGALPLMDLVQRAQPASTALVMHIGLVLALALVFGVVPSALLFASVAFATREGKAPTLRQAMPRAIAAFGPSALVFVSFALVELVLVFTAVFVGRWINDALYDRLGEARAEQKSAGPPPGWSSSCRP